jgi:hypothetical protein
MPAKSYLSLPATVMKKVWTTSCYALPFPKVAMNVTL